MKIKDLLMPTADQNLQEQDFYNINSLGRTQQKAKTPGLLSRFGQAAVAGIKRGAGIDQQTSLARGIAAKALGAANMPYSARAVDQSTPVSAATGFSPTIDEPLSSSILQNFAVGRTVDHPKLGQMKVKRANLHGVTFDTKDTFGHDLTMTPGQLKAAFGYR